jgi:peroxiredoxin-like protein
MTPKKAPHYFFEINQAWIGSDKGRVSIQHVDAELIVAPPVQFGGEAGHWSPEHLLLSAVSSCYMATLFAFAEKKKISITGFDCRVIGQVEPVAGKFRFTHINVYPVVVVADDALRTAAMMIAAQAERHCLVANSLDTDIIYHTAVKTAAISLQKKHGYLTAEDG